MYNLRTQFHLFRLNDAFLLRSYATCLCVDWRNKDKVQDLESKFIPGGGGLNFFEQYFDNGEFFFACIKLIFKLEMLDYLDNLTIFFMGGVSSLKRPFLRANKYISDEFKYRAGYLCEAVWPGDGEWYPAKVIRLVLYLFSVF